MAAVNEKGSPIASTIHLQTILNFCRTVVRTNDTQLQLAMSQYEQSLISGAGR